jgi:hypothetical protein
MEQIKRVTKLLSLPVDAKAWLQREAERNLSTVNSEIVRAIRQRMEQLQKSETAGR